MHHCVTLCVLCVFCASCRSYCCCCYCTCALCCCSSSVGDSVSLMTTAFVTSMSGCCCLASWMAMARAWKWQDKSQLKTFTLPSSTAAAWKPPPGAGQRRRLLWWWSVFRSWFLSSLLSPSEQSPSSQSMNEYMTSGFKNFTSIFQTILILKHGNTYKNQSECFVHKIQNLSIVEDKKVKIKYCLCYQKK